MQQPPQQFCLRWNNYQSNLTNVFDQLLQSESFVDVTLACEGHSVKAHKMVLSACSPYFQALFFDNPCQHPIVILKDIKWPELKAAVEFMYKGEINVSQEQIGPLLKVAESLKIRGLADVGSGGGGGGGGVGGGGGSSGSCEPEANGASTPPHHHHHHGGGDAPAGAGSVSPSATPQPPATPTSLSHAAACKKPWDLSTESCLAPSPGQRGAHPHPTQAKKRRRASAGERSSASSPEDSPSAPAAVAAAELLDDVPLPPQPQAPPPQPQAPQPQPLAPQQPPPQQQAPPPGPALGPEAGLPLPPPPPQQAQPAPHPEDLEIKPGIAEMIREEERAKLLESSHAWLGASTSSIAGWSRSGGQYSDSYQYQLQSMWQKCWNTNQSLVHNLRFRERGPLKSWRPETMAEAIFSVLREGLSLSQAARKYDIPYPTFVLYANRVHNMLGPSTDGGADLRPKGRGRPQRILLGSWPEEHIHGVIRAVVFRDTQHIKDDSHLGYPRLASHTQARRSPLPTNLVSRYVSSPLAVSGFSQHIKEEPDLTYSHLAQQMQETLQGYGAGTESGPSCTNGPETTMSPGVAAAAAVAVMAQGLRQQMCSVGATDATVAGLAGSLGFCLPPPNTHSHPATSNGGASPAVSGSPSPPAVPSPLASVGLGGGMPYKPPPSFASPRPETLFQEDIEEIVKSPNVGSSPQNLVKETKETTPVPVKLESSVEAQDE